MTKEYPVIELRAVVRGEVQGVGFRAMTRRFAAQLGVSGTVRNCHDGSVEIIVQGSREQVDALLNQLSSDPGLGRISSIETHYGSPVALFSSFQIVF